MFGLGFTEILFIAVLGLILIGPKQLPEVARTLGRFLNELKRSTNILTDEFKQQVKFDQNEIFNPRTLLEEDKKENITSTTPASADTTENKS